MLAFLNRMQEPFALPYLLPLLLVLRAAQFLRYPLLFLLQPSFLDYLTFSEVLRNGEALVPLSASVIAFNGAVLLLCAFCVFYLA
jgi:hypothetical protein